MIYKNAFFQRCLIPFFVRKESQKPARGIPRRQACFYRNRISTAFVKKAEAIAIT